MGLGFEQAGFDVLVAVDADPQLAAIHKYNHPASRTICRDILGFGARAREELELGHAEIDVVLGGPPCQGFSVIGKRQFDDPRNDLVEAFAIAAVALRPRYVVMENVEGLALKPMRAHLDNAREILANAGYASADPFVADAADFGVPQRRRRVLLLAWLGSERALSAPVPTHASEERSTLRPMVTVNDAIGRLADQRRRASEYVRWLNDANEHLSATRLGAPEDLTGMGLTKHSRATVDRFAATPQGAEETVSRYTRLRWDGQCHTMRAGTGPDHGSFMSARPIHPSQPRVITVREAARLHGYPDWFQFHRTKWHSFRGIGNSVPPPMARAVAASVVAALQLNPRKAGSVGLGDAALLAHDPRQAADAFGVDPTKNVRRTRKRRHESDVQSAI